MYNHNSNLNFNFSVQHSHFIPLCHVEKLTKAQYRAEDDNIMS